MEVVTGATGSVLTKVGALLQEEYLRQKGVKKDVESLQKELFFMRAALYKVAEVPPEQLDEQIKAWASNVKALSYDMEDAVDTFTVTVTASKEHENSSIPGMGKWNRMRARSRLADVIAEMKDLTMQVAELRDRYKLDDIHVTHTKEQVQEVKDVIARSEELWAWWRQRMAFRIQDVWEGWRSSGIGFIHAFNRGQTMPEPLVGMMNSCLGMSDEMMEVTRWVDSNNPKLGVFYMVGDAGVGKTRVAKDLYLNSGHKFDSRAEVMVSSRDSDAILKEINGKIHAWPKMPKSRHLVLIDDVDSESTWKIIKDTLSASSLSDGSCIKAIVTTRLPALAYQREKEDLMQRPALGDKEAKQIFMAALRESTSSDGYHDVHSIPARVWEMCGDHRMAMIAMAGYAAWNPLKSVDEWKQVCRKLLPDSRRTLGTNGVPRVLSHCYKDMPPEIKTCTLYLSMYPKGRIVSRKHLARRWMAEGFVVKQPGQSQEEVADDYFDQLVSRKMIQAVQMSNNGKVKKGRVYDLVHQFIVSEAIEENLVTVHKHGSAPPSANGRVRRLSFSMEMDPPPLHAGAGADAHANANASAKGRVRRLPFSMGMDPPPLHAGAGADARANANASANGRIRRLPFSMGMDPPPLHGGAGADARANANASANGRVRRLPFSMGMEPPPHHAGAGAGADASGQQHKMDLGRIMSLVRSPLSLFPPGEDGKMNLGRSMSHVRSQLALFAPGEDAKMNLGVTLSHVRSLALFVPDGKTCGSDEDVRSLLRDSPILQVLDLEGWSSVNVTEHHMKQICNMVLLKYLSFRGTKMGTNDEIWSHIGRLNNLETLDVRETSVTKLPAAIWQLQHLLNILGGNKKTGTPLELVAPTEKTATTKTLRVISGIKITQQLAEHLNKQTNLMKLAIYKVDIDTELKLQSLACHGSLRTLVIMVDDRQLIDLLDKDIQGSTFNKLSALDLSGKLDRLPEWIRQLASLTQLTLPITVFYTSPLLLKDLAELNNLMSLTFSDLGTGGVHSCIIQEIVAPTPTPTTGFEHLKLLQFIASMVPPLSFLDNAMPKLNKIHLCLTNFRGLHGIHNLHMLEEVHIEVNHGADDFTKSMLHDLLEATRRPHYKGPRILQDYLPLKEQNECPGIH